MNMRRVPLVSEMSTVISRVLARNPPKCATGALGWICPGRDHSQLCHIRDNDRAWRAGRNRIGGQWPAPLCCRPPNVSQVIYAMTNTAPARAEIGEPDVRIATEQRKTKKTSTLRRTLYTFYLAVFCR